MHFGLEAAVRRKGHQGPVGAGSDNRHEGLLSGTKRTFRHRPNVSASNTTVLGIPLSAQIDCH